MLYKGSLQWKGQGSSWLITSRIATAISRVTPIHTFILQRWSYVNSYSLCNCRQRGRPLLEFISCYRLKNIPLKYKKWYYEEDNDTQTLQNWRRQQGLYQPQSAARIFKGTHTRFAYERKPLKGHWPQQQQEKDIWGVPWNFRWSKVYHQWWQNVNRFSRLCTHICLTQL